MDPYVSLTQKFSPLCLARAFGTLTEYSTCSIGASLGNTACNKPMLTGNAKPLWMYTFRNGYEEQLRKLT